MSISRSITAKPQLSQALVVLNKIGRSLINVQDPSSVLNQIAKDAKDVLGADIVDLYEYNQTRDEFILPPILEGKRLKPKISKNKIYGDDVVVKVVKAGKPQYFPDARNAASLIRKFDISRKDTPDDRFVIREKVASSVSLPLKAGEETVGVMFVNYRTRQKFNDEQKNLIESFSNLAAIAIHNARILEDLQHRVRGHQALNQIGDKLSDLLDETEILREIVRSANKALDCIHCTVFRLQDEQLVIIAAEGEFAQSLKPGRTFKLGQGIAGWVAQHGKATLVMNTLLDERFEFGWHDTEGSQTGGGQNEPGSLIVVPIFLNNVVYGVISIEQSYIAGFTQLDQEFLEILARQASSAIENAQLVERLHILNSVSRELSSKLDIQFILDETVNATFKTINCSHSTFFVLENDLLTPKASKSKKDQLLVTRVFRVGDGLVGRVVEKGKSISTGDARKEDGFSIGARLPDVDRSMILVPVKTTGRIFGVISIDQDRINAFSKQDLQMVETLALQTGIAIENAKLLEQMKFLQDISTSISAAQNIKDTLKLIVEGAMQLTGTDVGVIHLIDDEKLEISNSYAYPNDGLYISSRFSKKKGFTWKVYSTGKAVSVPDVTKNKVASKKLIELGVRSLIGVPLKIEGKTIGTLFLNDNQVHEFSEQEKELLLTLANNAAIAIEKTRLNVKLDNLVNRKIKNLNAVIEMGKYLTASVNLNETEVLDLIYQKITPLMNTENMYIALYDHATDLVRFPLMFLDGKAVEVPTRKAGSGRTEHIISSKKPLFIQTREESVAWYKQTGREEYIGDPLASWIGVPMISGDQAIGVIATYHKTDDFVYDQDDLEILQAIANQAAIALEVTQRIAELKALQSLTNDLSAGLL